VPAKPTGLTFTTDTVELPGRTGTDGMPYEVTHTVRWDAPRTEGVEIRVYGVTECLSEPNDPPPGTSGPCLVEHTLLPSSVMALAASAPAAAGEISWIRRVTGSALVPQSARMASITRRSSSRPTTRTVTQSSRSHTRVVGGAPDRTTLSAEPPAAAAALMRSALMPWHGPARRRGPDGGRGWDQSISIGQSGRGERSRDYTFQLLIRIESRPITNHPTFVHRASEIA
jgi:hypothetical protein